MYQRILLPLDGSKVGEAALPVIEELVSKLSLGQLQVEVTLLHVISELTHWVVAAGASAPVPYTDEELQLLKKKAEDYLQKTSEQLTAKGVSVKTEVKVGSAADEIIKVADEINADLIAMSTHGRSGISRWAFGSITDKVLRAANKPILVVRAPKDATEAATSL